MLRAKGGGGERGRGGRRRGWSVSTDWVERRRVAERCVSPDVQRRGAGERPGYEVEGSMSPTSADYRMAIQAMSTTPECARLRSALARNGRSCVASWASYNRAAAAAAEVALHRRQAFSRALVPTASLALHSPLLGLQLWSPMRGMARDRPGLLSVLRDDGEASDNPARSLVSVRVDLDAPPRRITE